MRPAREDLVRAAAGKPGETQRIAAALLAGRPLDLVDLSIPSRLSREWRGKWFRARAAEFLGPAGPRV